jgi:hypothetical protein
MIFNCPALHPTDEELAELGVAVRPAHGQIEYFFNRDRLLVEIGVLVLNRHCEVDVVPRRDIGAHEHNLLIGAAVYAVSGRIPAAPDVWRQLPSGRWVCWTVLANGGRACWSRSAIDADEALV